MAKSPRQRLEDRFIPEPNSGCFIWTGGLTHLGYGKFDALTKAHRASWTIHYGEIPDSMHVLHKCDLRCCVNPDHLFLGTHTDNMKDMWAKGRHGKSGQKGSVHWASKLTEDDIREIRNSPLGNREIAPLYGVVHSRISAIRTRNAWRHVK